jgi:hypothetical protein
MNYKIKITEENQAIVKRIADENGMNPNLFDFNPESVCYEIMEEKFVYLGTILNSEFRILTTEKFIEMFDKKQSEWKPKRGERVLVWDENDDPVERFFIDKIDNCLDGIIIVQLEYEKTFLNGNEFRCATYEYMKQIPKPEAIVETDFKTKVVELIEKRIEIHNKQIDDCYKGKVAYTALNLEICKGELEDILERIKEL